MSMCIPTYMLASGLIAGGMNWWQAIGTILLGNLIVLVPMLLNAHAGAKYGIPFPVSSALVRRARRQHSRRAARPGRLRMVRHPDLDRRPGHLLHAAHPLARRRAPPGGSLGLLLRLLAAEHGRDLARHRDHQVPGRHRRALHARRRPAAALVDHRAKPADSAPCSARPASFTRQRRVPALLRPLAHRHGGLLGDGGAEHPRFHPLRQARRRRRCWARRSACPPP